MSGRLTIWIDGREALPVRAIPYVAGWQHLYSPDVLAGSLARAIAAPFGKLRNLYAYHRQEGKPLPVMANEWRAVTAKIKGFEDDLHAKRPDVDAMNDDAGYAEWCKVAALELPAGMFVWLDEFLREREVDREFAPDNEPVTFAPWVDADTRAALLKGFEDCPRRGPHADRAMIGYADFRAICQVDDLANFGGFRVKTNGLYVNLPPTDALLTPEERAAVSWHPTGQYDKPALPLPCTLGQLRAFLPDAGMTGHIEEGTVDALLGELVTWADAVGNGNEAPKVGAGETAEDSPAIPGKLSPVAIGKLAITAAWQIECETKRRASAKEVMTQLQAWADAGKESAVLTKSLPAKRAVQWLTAKSEHREYTIEACQETLKKWNESRQ